MRLRRRIRRTLLAAALGGLGVLLVEAARLPDVEELLERALPSSVVLDRMGSPIRYALSPDEKLRPWVPLAEVHPLLVSATLAAEDARFQSHQGVDFLAVARALWTNLSRGRTVSGASTISMQVARLLRPLPRGYYSKLREALLAFKLEAVLGKDRVLELYLNLSPYGGNLHGVEAAARRYLGRAPRDLSLSEAALISGLPQSPRRLRPDRNPDGARARRDWVLDRMAVLGMVEPGAAAEAKSAPVAGGSHPLPLVAPHFGQWALDRLAPGSRVRTTLDPGIQTLVEEVLRIQLAELAPARVRNAAAIVVETESGRIRALVGSQDFASPSGGQVNGSAAPRSPGSLLKPFIYALAFERGVAGPTTLLDDSPRAFRDGYEPRNFSGGFVGPVRAGEALARSLNVPAVDLLARVGPALAAARLRDLGLRGIKGPAGRYGLTLALGGVELSLLELVEAYATLGRLGLHRPLSFREEEPPAEAVRVLSARAAYDVAEALADAAWPRDQREGGLELPRLALKTGTSFGLRDAWAIAYDPRFTVAVWFGNFGALPSPALVGQTAAAPAALEIERRLHAGGSDVWYAEPPLVPAGRPPAELRPASGPRWVLPPDGASYVAHGRPGGDVVPFHAEIEPGSSVCFLVDGRFAGRVFSGETLPVALEPGAHRVAMTAPGGRVETRAITVEPRRTSAAAGPGR